tara:strand:- start:323 stop:508 length:186 start_codon:yes stop_codon:yes gene_type:complete
MARKTTEELQQELKDLEKNHLQAQQVIKNCETRAIAIDAILKDRAEADAEKKQLETLTAKV